MINRLLKQSRWGTAVLFAGSVAAGIQILDAQAPENLPHFDVVSIKPYKPRNNGRGGDLRDPMFLPGGRFTSRAPLMMVIGAAYDVPFFGPTARISGGPEWIRSLDLVYDIEATPGKDNPAGGKQMLQALLADRFKLMLRRETKANPRLCADGSKKRAEAPES